MRERRQTQRSTAAHLFVALLLTALAGSADAANSCSATGVMAGQSFALQHCAAAVMPGGNSVTIWFNEKEITAAERETFSMSAYASSYHDGGERTMFLLAFCPGGGATTASPQAVTRLQLDMSHAKAPLASATWLLDDRKEFKVERLEGEAVPGGRLVGRITGQRSSDGRPYRFDLTFDLQLPTQEATAGIACGS
ncbi:MAG: hypothetical protein HRF46_02630 [Acidobacteriota bacterium]|jgi:hypothetical protein